MFDRRLISHFEWILLLLTLLVIGIGVMSIYSATYEEGQPLNPLVCRQLSWIGLGLVSMLIIFAVDYRRLEDWAYVFYGFSIALLLLVPVLGSFGGGARRWISLGVFSLQPSELMKISLLLALARDFHLYSPPDGYRLRDLWFSAVLAAVPIGLILAEPNLGTAAIIGIVAFSMMFVAGIRKPSLALLTVVGGSMVPVFWQYMKPYQRQRVLSFLSPELDPLGAGYHMIQAKITVGSGMLWGKGFLEGTQNRLDFLPEQHTDFIFAVFAEEWGFVGTVMLLVLYGALLMRLLAIAWKASDRFGSLVVIGVASLVFWQMLINLGMNVGILPVVGVPLPLLSYGGSSLLSMMMALGLALNISTRRFLFRRRGKRERGF